jgi:hypothetical protein
LKQPLVTGTDFFFFPATFGHLRFYTKGSKVTSKGISGLVSEFLQNRLSSSGFSAVL